VEKSRPSRSRERPGSPRARLFLALDIPAGCRSRLAAWRDEALRGRDDLRPVREEALHVTLVFLGYRPEKEIPKIAATAFGALRGLPPARLRAGGVKAIPPRRPRLFALDLEDRAGTAAAVQAAASEALAAARFYKPEKRPFWPHVTFARVKRNARAEPLEASPPPAGPFEAREVTLYRSLLSAQGARYEPLERMRLGGSSAA
jgi:RNA 2',3'-cyclic 3'-phosphodiesterase